MNLSPITSMPASPDHFKSILSDESSHLLQRLKEITTSYFFWPDQNLTAKLKELKPIDLAKILDVHFLEAIHKNLIKDPIQFLDRLAAIIPLASLQEASPDKVDNILEEAKEMFEEAKFYLHMTNEKLPQAYEPTSHRFWMESSLSLRASSLHLE